VIEGRLVRVGAKDAVGSLVYGFAVLCPLDPQLKLTQQNAYRKNYTKNSMDKPATDASYWGHISQEFLVWAVNHKRTTRFPVR
jgi:hypothetical protein